MEAVRTRRWYRLHLLTWIAVVIECAAIARCQFIKQLGTGFSPGPAPFARKFYYGSPAIYLVRLAEGFPGASPTSRSTWYLPSLALNCVCWALIVASVGTVIESWMRRPKRWQFSVRGMGLFTFVVAAVIALVKQQSWLTETFGHLGLLPGIVFDYLAYYPADWPVLLAILFGIGCLLGLIVYGACRVAVRLLGLLTRNSANDAASE